MSKDHNMERSQLLEFARIAETTYNDPGKHEFAKLGYQVVKYFDRKGAQAYLIQNRECRILTFRGTQVSQPSDVIADVRAVRRQEPMGNVHRGFRGELDKIWHDILHELEQGSLPLYITGHSLGAAMATLAASRLAPNKVQALVTFGSPRVGNRRFVANLFVDHYRVINNNDAVTKVPLWIMGYRHHGRPVYLNYHGDIRDLTVWQRVKDMLRSRRRAMAKWQFFKGVYDHLMAHYIEKLQKGE